MLLFPGALVTDTAHADARSDYAEHCAVCHGPIEPKKPSDRRQILRQLSDFSPPSLGLRLSREAMIEVVRDGRPGTPMAGWSRRLGSTRIEALVDHIRTRVAEQAASAPAQQDHPGAALYQRHCASCHGADGAGSDWAKSSLSTVPTNFTNRRIAAKMSRERMVFSTVNGRPGTAMPAYAGKLDRTQIEQFVDYVGVLMTAQEAARDVAGEVQATEKQAPDPGNGEALYRAYCADCHGLEGAGDGPRARLSQPAPRSLRGRSLGRGSILTVTREGVDGTSMPAMGHVLDAQELADLAEYVFLVIASAAEPQ